MPKVQNLNGVLEALKKLESKIGREKQPSVVVGYTAAYAIYVHENVGMKLKGKARTGTRPDKTKRKGRYSDPKEKGKLSFWNSQQEN